jgi:hypothetical protein
MRKYNLRTRQSDGRVVEELFRCAPMTRVRLGSSWDLVYLPLRRKAYTLPTAALESMSACAQFKTIAEFANHGMGGAKVEESAGHGSAFCELAKLGLLVSADEFLAKSIETASTENSHPEISWLAIPTGGRRPEQLNRAFESYTSHVSQFGHNIAVLISDDCSSSTMSHALDSKTIQAATHAGTRVFYAGKEQKVRFAIALGETNEIPADVIHFALFGAYGGETIGANRNAILLNTLGSLVLSVDDDTICKPAVAPHAAEQTLMSGMDGELGEFWFFPDRESALRNVGFQDRDVVGEHERLLGKSVPQVFFDALQTGSVDLDGICSHLFNSLLSDQGHITLTSNGMVGDSGMANNLSVRMYQDEATRDRLDSEDAIKIALSSREVIRQFSGPTISHPAPFISTFFGLDNRRLLPPFFPVYRNDEGVFAQILSQCIEHQYAGHLPFTLIHAPSEKRFYSTASPLSVRVSDIVLASLGSWSGGTSGRTTATALTELGRHLVELGSMAQADFDETVRALLWKRASVAMFAMESQVRRLSTKGREYWAANVSGLMRDLRSAVPRPEYLLPVDLLKSFPPSKCLYIARDLVKQFGDLLCWWPAMVERSKKLSNDGRPLGEEI